MLALRAHVLALGYSGVRVEVVERMVEMLNRDLIPAVPEQGSLGASGDLAPLACLALPLLGLGRILTGDGAEPAAGALARAGLEPLELGAKEGLALVNGTQGMLAVGIMALARADRLLRTADVIAAMTIEAALGTDARVRRATARVAAASRADGVGGEPPPAARRLADPRVAPRLAAPRAGRIFVALHAAGPRRLARHRSRTSAGCSRSRRTPSPTTRSCWTTATSAAEATSTGCPSRSRWTPWRCRSSRSRRSAIGGCTGCSTPPGPTGCRRSSCRRAGSTAGSCSCSTRRPPSCPSRKSLAHPASVDSIPSSAGQEDHVSMGMTAARHARAVVDNAEVVLALEALASGAGARPALAAAGRSRDPGGARRDPRARAVRRARP